jgi:hypothetical protein
MAAESLVAGKRSAKMAELVFAAIGSLGLELPREFEECRGEEWMSYLRADKKNRGGKMELTVLCAPGRKLALTVGSAELLEAIKALPAAYPRAAWRPSK